MIRITELTIVKCVDARKDNENVQTKRPQWIRMLCQPSTKEARDLYEIIGDQFQFVLKA